MKSKSVVEWMSHGSSYGDALQSHIPTPDDVSDASDTMQEEGEAEMSEKFLTSVEEVSSRFEETS